jgi:thymidylate synthase
MLDAHIYSDHIRALESQLTREPRPFPRLKILTPPGGSLESLERLTFEDFELSNYEPHGKLAMNMSA